MPREKLWDAALGALEKNRIPALSSDKAAGIIQTDYIEGPAALIGLGLGGARGTRYKYNIAFRNQSDDTIKLNIICKLESTVSSGHGSSQWTDVSSQNAGRVKDLEIWLYEEVEKRL